VSRADRELGLIGDLQTATLVATDGSIDWFCCPRFASPSVFANLLDPARGGFLRIAPSTDEYVVKLGPHTYMCVPSGRRRMSFLASITREKRTSSKSPLTERSSARRMCGYPSTVRKASQHDADGVCATQVLRAGDVRGIVLESGVTAAPRAVSAQEALGLFEDTVRFWRQRLARSTSGGRWREMVDRSAITLTLLTSAPSGGLVAAPAQAFARWLRQRLEAHAGSVSGPLKIMYRADGSSDLVEQELDHLMTI